MFRSRRSTAYTILAALGIYLIASISVSVMRGYSTEGIVRNMIKKQFTEVQIEEVNLEQTSSSMRVTQFKGFCVLQQKEFRRALTFELRIDHPHFLNIWTQSEGSINEFKPARLDGQPFEPGWRRP